MIARVMGYAMLFAAAGLLGGCGGSSGGGNGGGAGAGGTAPPAPPPPSPGDPYDPAPPVTGLEPTFSSIQSNVFSPSCTSCHIGAAAPEGLMLDTGSSYGLLVGVNSTQVPSLQRVNPGNPDDSYLIQKLEGTAAVGERMPLDAPPLAEATIAVIRQWILEGAAQGIAPVSSKPMRASGSSIVPNSVVDELPEEIIVMFDRELDFSTVNRATVSLVRSGGNGSFGDENEVPVEISGLSLSLLNPRALTIHLGGLPSVADVYRVVLSASPPSAIQDTAGNRLDGNWVQTFPSGDGNEGGDLHIEFTVAGTPE